MEEKCVKREHRRQDVRTLDKEKAFAHSHAGHWQPLLSFPKSLVLAAGRPYQSLGSVMELWCPAQEVFWVLVLSLIWLAVERTRKGLFRNGGLEENTGIGKVGGGGAREIKAKMPRPGAFGEREWVLHILFFEERKLCLFGTA